MSYSIDTFTVPGDLSSIRRYWLQLTDQHPHNFYQSWHWIGTWLALLPSSADVTCVICKRDNEPVLGFFVGRNTWHKFGILPVKAAHLNETGDHYLDGITVEQNDVVGERRELDAFLQHTWLLGFMRVVEFNFRFATERLRGALQEAPANQYFAATPIPCPYVDLKAIRANGQDYNATLSKNRRQQIRRAIRHYEKDGPLRLRIAQSLDEAQRMLEAMGELHQQSWAMRGKKGSFANSHFVAFHRALLENSFASGHIVVSEVSTPKAVVGYIYGFVYNNSFLFYQSGLNYAGDNKLKPGFVAHYMLINHFLDQDIDRYDFLAGEAGYKTSLATDTQYSYHLASRKKNIVFGLLQVKNRLEQWLGRRAQQD